MWLLEPDLDLDQIVIVSDTGHWAADSSRVNSGNTRRQILARTCWHLLWHCRSWPSCWRTSTDTSTSRTSPRTNTTPWTRTRTRTRNCEDIGRSQTTWCLNRFCDNLSTLIKWTICYVLLNIFFQNRVKYRSETLVYYKSLSVIVIIFTQWPMMVEYFWQFNLLLR